MKSIHQFKRLSIEQKLLAIDQAGIDLSIAIFRDHESSLLFSLHLFYVEVTFERACRSIKRVRCFTTMKKLAPYLEQINIDDLTVLLSYPQK